MTFPTTSRTAVHTVTPSFQNELVAVPPKISRQILRAMDILRRDPTNAERALDIKKLQEVDLWRLRVDDYRVFYTQEGHVQCFRSVLPRKDAYARLGISDTDGMQVVPDVVLPRAVKPGAPSPLPHPLTLDLLTRWQVPADLQPALAVCTNEDQLLEVTVPYPVFSRLIDLLYSKRWQDRLSQPQYVLGKATDLEDLAEGNLTTRLLRLDDHQRHISALNLEGSRAPMVVKGGPGSGKSTVALYRAKLLVERYPDARIGYTTYTNALKASSREQLEVLLPEDHRSVRVETVDSLALSILRTTGEEIGEPYGPTALPVAEFFEGLARPAQLKRFSLRYIRDEIFEVIELSGLDSEASYLASQRTGRRTPLSAAQRRLIWGLYEEFSAWLQEKKAVTWASLRKRTLTALEDGRLKPMFDYLMVDEAQDLSPITLNMLAHMVATPGGLYLTADANQTLYESSFSWDALRSGWPEAEIHVLKRNYRNTAELVRAFADVRQALGTEDAEASLEEGLATGPRPRVIVVPQENEVARLIEEIRAATRETHEPQRRVAILVAGDVKTASIEGVRLAKLLKAQKLKANYMSSEGLKLDADCIKVLSLQTSKGLEFPIVMLWNVLDGVLPRDLSELPSEEQTEEGLKDRRLFYVGCSRAMTHLSVFTRPGQESELLDDLQAEHWDTVNA